MNDFRKPGGFEGARGGNRFPKKSFSGSQGYQQSRDQGSERPRLYQAVCSQCGKSCEVPFRPNGKKPVYCSECFGAHKAATSSPNDLQKRESAPQSSFQSRVEDRGMNDLKRQLDAVHTKMDRILQILEASTGVKAPIVAQEAPKTAEITLREVIRKAAPKKMVFKKAANKKK